MAQAPRPAPQVTITDPARPARAPDLLDSEPAPVARGRRLRAVALLGVAGLLAGGLELQERRRSGAEQRQLDARVVLTAQAEDVRARFDPATRRAELEVQVLLANDGPRDLRVVEAELVGHRLVLGEVRLRSDDTTPLLLRRVVTCSTDAPPPAPPAAGLALRLRTPAGPRDVQVPVDLSSPDDRAARACGFVPLEEAVGVAVLGAAALPGALELAVELTPRSVRPVDLLGLELGPGLSGELRAVDGDGNRDGGVALPVRLPTVALPPGSEAPGSELGFLLRVRAADCDAAIAGAGSPRLALLVRDEAGRTARVETLYELGYLMGLLLQVC